jgi:hypothetical protein
MPERFTLPQRKILEPLISGDPWPELMMCQKHPDLNQISGLPLRHLNRPEKFVLHFHRAVKGGNWQRGERGYYPRIELVIEPNSRRTVYVRVIRKTDHELCMDGKLNHLTLFCASYKLDSKETAQRMIDRNVTRAETALNEMVDAIEKGESLDNFDKFDLRKRTWPWQRNHGEEK